MISEEAAKIAAQCRHYAMCKIDYLGTGICPPARKKPYVAYFPQGRMDIYHYLANGLIPVTEALVDIAESCTLCGICDKQCHFVTELRPFKVMKALKEYVDGYLKNKGNVLRPRSDRVLKALQGIVGDEWATNDPAILATYANDPFPLAEMRMPRYVVLPATTDEVAKTVRLAKRRGLDLVVRGNGGSVFGFVFTDGIVIDTNRMKDLEIDRENWSVRVGAGVTSFELQSEVLKHGCRVNAAEPAATTCGNIVCTGIFSTWSNAYGTCSDNFVDVEFVDWDGNIFRLNDRTAPNIFGFQNAMLPLPGICTSAVVRLHPTTDDEEGMLIPFAELEDAVAFARELSMRRIGLAIGVLGGHYLATFMSPTKALADELKTLITETLGIQYAVFVIGDAYARGTIGKMSSQIIDSGTLRNLMLGLPRLLNSEWTELLANFQGDGYPFEILCRKEMRLLLEAALDPSPQTLAGAVDEDLREFYIQLYSRPEMTDMVWLNACRIVSARMSRHKHMFAFLIYVPLDRADVIKEIISGFETIARKYGIDHDYGFITPMDLGKRGILEYDYYLDHTDEGERGKIRRAMVELDPWLDSLADRTKGVTLLKHVFGQGCSRKETFMYR